MVIVVTRMDESYLEVKESERLSDENVKLIVSNGIKKALGLDFVSPDIVFPVSGKLAFQVSESILVYTASLFAHSVSVLSLHKHSLFTDICMLQITRIASRHVKLVRMRE